MKKLNIVPIEFFANQMIFQIPEYSTREDAVDVSVVFNDTLYTFSRSIEWVQEKVKYNGLIVVEVKVEN